VVCVNQIVKNKLEYSAIIKKINLKAKTSTISHTDAIPGFILKCHISDVLCSTGPVITAQT